MPKPKEKLFTWPRLRLAVVNLDDPFGRELAQRTTATKILGYTQNNEAIDRQAVVSAENVEETLNGVRFRLLRAEWAGRGRNRLAWPLQRVQSTRRSRRADRCRSETGPRLRPVSPSFRHRRGGWKKWGATMSP